MLICALQHYLCHTLLHILPKTSLCVWFNSTEFKLREKHNWMKLWTLNLMPFFNLSAMLTWGSILHQFSQLRCDSRASSSQAQSAWGLLKARSPHPMEEGPPRISPFPHGWFSWPGWLRVRTAVTSAAAGQGWEVNGLGSVTANQPCLSWDTVLTSCK